jgi:ferritin-like metal-binding protein YciE
MANTTITKRESAGTRTATARKSSAGHTRNGTARRHSANGDHTEPLLKSFFIEELKDIYWAEKKLVSSLPKLQKAACTDALKTAIGEHLEETRRHVTRLEDIFEQLGKKAQAKKCEAMEGIIEESQTVIEDTEEGTATRDVALIMAAQKAEHYEIATYGGLRQLAITLGLDEIADTLNSTLEEEKKADDLLTDIAENDINYQAAGEGNEEEENGEEEEEEEE